MQNTADKRIFDNEIQDQVRKNTALPIYFYKMIFDHACTAVLLADRNNRIITANSMLQQLSGYSLEELRDMESWIEILEEGSRSRVTDWIDGNHYSGTGSRHFEACISCRNREKIQLYAAVSHIHEEDLILVSMTDITELKQTQCMLYHKAFHDHLTGLPNQALFMEVLTLAVHRAKRNPDYLFSVLFLDIDQFKDINDSMGHQTGDRILVRFAETVKGCLRNTDMMSRDMMSRMGGDEFAVILDGIQSPEDTGKVVDRIFTRLKEPFDIGDSLIPVQVSMGIVSDCRHYDCAEDIVRDADIAMYGAKDAGRSCYKVFEHELDQRFRHVQEMEKALTAALENEEFILYYQPIVCLNDKKVVSFEALIRWEKPGTGLIPAARFIPVAEKTRQILTMSKWVLTRACSQMRKWQLSYPAMASCSVCVNLSFNQLKDPALEKIIVQALETSGLPACYLQLEIAEAKSLLAQDKTVDFLKRLHQMGVKIIVDDFGTGYASLNFLHRYPIHCLKLDRSLVEGLDNGGSPKDSEIVKAIISLAHNLDLKVVAEGVERAAQQKYLTSLKCNYAQGYLFFRPMPPDLINPEYLERLVPPEE